MALSYKRRKQEQKIIKKRLKQLQIGQIECEDKAVEQPHRLSKRRAFGCNRSKCRTCHPDKW